MGGYAGGERQDGQSFVRDLLGVYGITETRAATYEKRARRSSTGRQGYIDALVPGLALIEMKSAGKSLVDAEQQALDYLDDLADPEMPSFVITSDFRRFRILDLKAEGDGVTEFALADLRDNAESLSFFAGYRQRAFGSIEQERASIEAAQLMASLYEGLEGSGYDDHAASVFLVRTLFALYADDAGVWERDLFLEFLETRTTVDGSDLGPQLALLYQTMGTEVRHRQKNLDEFVARFPYVNGGVFEEPLRIPSFDASMRERLLIAAKFNWAEISPAIFGSLFQSVKSKEDRRELGEHYTTETNILKVIGPLFLDELRERFAEDYHDVENLRALRRDMGRMHFLDPACGCGNFLVVGYRELRLLDLEILQQLQQLGAEDFTLVFTEDHLTVTLENFHGIELEEWPARIAATALHLADHQANMAMELALGVAPDSLPLDRIDTIRVGNALQINWRDVVVPTGDTVVMGNPPFIGARIMSPSQKAELQNVWGASVGELDYVTGWYKKASDFFEDRSGRFAFVSTNSIAQGTQAPALFGPLLAAGWSIRFAHRTFAWTSEAANAAAVHCVIVGFDRRRRSSAQLFVHKKNDSVVEVVPEINGYLLPGKASILVSSRRHPLSPDLPPVSFGSMANDGGAFFIEPAEYDRFMSDPIASKYVRKFVGARELINSIDRWCLWMEDLEPADVQASVLLRSRIDDSRRHREGSSREATKRLALTPYLFGERRQPDTEYVCVPRHFSEHRLFATTAYLGPEIIAGDANFKIDDPDGLAFAAISSSAFITWQRIVGGRIKSDLRFSGTLVWNTFPLPALTNTQRETIIAGGRAVLEARALHPERSLADHYNPLAMAPELLKAHRKLDAAVDAVFGLKGSVDELDRQRALFASYEKLMKADQLPAPKKKRATRKKAAAAVPQDPEPIDPAEAGPMDEKGDPLPRCPFCLRGATDDDYDAETAGYYCRDCDVEIV